MIRKCYKSAQVMEHSSNHYHNIAFSLITESPWIYRPQQVGYRLKVRFVCVCVGGGVCSPAPPLPIFCDQGQPASPSQCPSNDTLSQRRHKQPASEPFDRVGGTGVGQRGAPRKDNCIRSVKNKTCFCEVFCW